MDHDLYLKAFLATLALSAGAWVVLVLKLVRVSGPGEGRSSGSLRRVLGIEIVWTLVPAALVLALTMRILMVR
jgi:heme/copper-type cytochrome/quinol oxidase subunit 2